jgi:hypothetical protein
MFMSAALQLPTPITEPDPPPPDRALPAAIGRVLGVVRELIGYGRQLAATLQQRAAAPGFALFAKPFGTTDVAVILVRITNGLRRAAALEAWLSQRAARGKDVPPPPIRLPTFSAGASSDARSEPPTADPAQDPRLVRLLTEEEVAAEVRRRPVGAVVADICRDLGIMAPHPLWGELRTVIIHYGGDLAKLWKDILRNVRPRYAVDRPPAAPEQSLPSPAPAATGPP